MQAFCLPYMLQISTSSFVISLRLKLKMGLYRGYKLCLNFITLIFTKPYHLSCLQTRVGPNSEYQIIQFLKILRIPNYLVFENFTNTDYQIVLFGLNYSNTEYLKLNSSPPKNFICEFCDQMRWGKFDPLFSYLHEGFYCVFYTYLSYKRF